MCLRVIKRESAASRLPLLHCARTNEENDDAGNDAGRHPDRRRRLPGLNAVIRAVAKSLIRSAGAEVIGIEQGFLA